MRRGKVLVKVLACLFLLPLSTSLAQAQPAPVPKTGQTTSYATGDDGYYEKGVAWPVPRFTDDGDQTVTDNLTGLIWTKDADLFGTTTWAGAISACESLEKGSCGCNPCDDWRLPNRFELGSLSDLGNHLPALPTGHPFSNVQSDYWSSTYYSPLKPIVAWSVNMTNGNVNWYDKNNSYYVWCVRGPE